MAVQKVGGLGKGLGALFGDDAGSLIPDEAFIPDEPGAPVQQAVDNKSVTEVDINSISPNRSQPRNEFNEEKLEELARSITEHGIIQPILVRPGDKGYELVAGERRWRAARMAGLKKVPCIVKDIDERENMLIALIENTHREDLTPIDEALAYNDMAEKFGISQAEIAKSVGKSRPYISNSLRLLKLPQVIRDMVTSGQLSGAHGRTIAGIEGEKEQLEAAEKAVRLRLSVRELEEIATGTKEEPDNKKTPSSKPQKDKFTLALESELREVLGTKVNIKDNGKKGKIEIDFFSREEFDRLTDMLKTLA